MKKTLLALFTMFSLSSFAQSETKKNPPSCYVAGSLSMSTGDNFKQSSYPSLEVGISATSNLSFGFNMGRMNIDKSPYSGEKIDNYYYEVKSTATFPLGSLKGFVIGGWGKYYNSTHSFLECGGGMIYSIKKIDLVLQVSNWDQIMFLSPGIVYNFKL